MLQISNELFPVFKSTKLLKQVSLSPMSYKWLNFCHLKTIYGLRVWSTNTPMSRNFTLPVLIISLREYKLQYQIHSLWTCLFFVVHLPLPRESIFHFMALPFSQEVCNLPEGKTESYSIFCLTFVREDTREKGNPVFHKDFPSTAVLPLETWFELLYYLNHQSPKEIFMFAAELLARGFLKNRTAMPP